MHEYGAPKEYDKKSPKNTVKNKTGIPEAMKTKYENFSGCSLDDVRVHYNSGKPSQLRTLAYTQGNHVYVSQSQEKHLGHELGHVIQQKQGRVPTEVRLGLLNLNLNPALEREADRIAQSLPTISKEEATEGRLLTSGAGASVAPVQMRLTLNYDDYYRQIKGMDEAPAITKETINNYLDFFDIGRELKFLPDNYYKMPASELGIESQEATLGYYSNIETAAQAIFNIRDADPLVADQATETALRDAIQNFITNSDSLYREVPKLDSTQYENTEGNTLTATHLALHDKAYESEPVVTPLSPAGSNIPELPFSSLQPVLPRSLCNLLRDIYIKWMQGSYLDRRPEPDSSHTAPDEPGGLRTYHMNSRGSLPSPLPLTKAQKAALNREHRPVTPAEHMGHITEAQVTEGIADNHGHGLALHNHYKATSKMDNGATIEQTDGPQHPAGYAEYTGIAFGGGAPHECKIVLNYINGEIYLTLSHYQYYRITVERDQRNLIAEGQNPSEHYSPWYKINMTE